MKNLRIIPTLLLLFAGIVSLNGQSANTIEVKKAKNYKAKKEALEYLSLPETIEKYGKISDRIWTYAELGMQEFKI